MSVTDASLPSRFTAVRELGAGAFGRVYAADLNGRAAAVKVLAPALAHRPDMAWAFAAEWRMLARLAHPAFPAAWEEGHTLDGRPYYAMALVEGREPVGPWPAADVRKVLVALADALAYLHGLGLSHGDLKPENVRVTADGRVSVLDVGMVLPVGRGREVIAGTLAYMAPEILRKAPVDPRSDLYALGALAHELWAGTPPFHLDPPDAAALVRAHLTQLPPTPPEAPADPGLAGLIGSLLAKDPAARPASARAVAAWLRGEPVPDEGPTGLREAPLLGREPVLAAWRAVLAENGRLAIDGDSGLGRTYLLEALRVEALLAGRAWVGAATGANDAPGAALRAAVSQAVAAAEMMPSDALAAWLAGRLPAAFADLEPAARRIALAALAADALETAATTLKGIAIGFDDWERADAVSRDLAGLTARVLAERGAAVCWVTARTATTAPAAPRVTDPPDPLRDGAIRATLAPLSTADATALITARLGSPSPVELLDRLLPAAAGRPALLTLLLEHLVATGALTPAAGGWTLVEGAAGVPMPTSLDAAWVARLTGLSADARRLAAMLAVAAPAGRVAAALLADVAGLTPLAARLALDALTDEGLACEAAGRVRLAVPGMAPAFATDLAPAELASLSASLAHALLDAARGHVEGSDEDDGDRLAEAALTALPPDILAAASALAARGDDDALAAPLAATMGRTALALGAPAEALDLFERATARGATDLALPRAEALRLLDRLDEAREAYAAAASLDLPGPEAATAWIGLAKVRQMQGDYPAALAGYAQAEAVGTPTQMARAVASEARVRAFRGEPALALAAAERAEALAREAHAEAVLAQALSMRGYLMATADPVAAPAAIALLDEALAIGERLGDRVGVALALDNLGNVHLATGDLAAAAAVYAHSVAHCLAAGLATEGLAAGLNQAIVAAERGDVELALAQADAVARRAETLGRKFVRAAALTAAAQAHARSGHPAPGRALLDEALVLADAIGNKLLEEHVRLYAVEVALAAGNVTLAATEAERVSALVADTGHAEAAARLAVLSAERLRLAGDPTAAHATALLYADAPNRVAAHLARRILAELALHSNQGTAAQEHAQAALTIARDWDAPWHLAADLALLARAQAASGDPAAAAATADEALRHATFNPAARAEAELLARPRSTATADGVALDLAAYAAWLTALAGAGDESAIAQTALDAAMALVHADRGYVLAYHEGRLQKALVRGLDLAAEVEGGFSSSMVQRAMVTGEPLYVADARTDADFSSAASVMALDLRTVVVLPLTTPDALLGVLYMDRTAVDPLLGPADLHLLGALATTATAAMLRERARGDAEAGLGLLSALTTGLVPTLQRRDIARALLDAAREATGAERAYWLIPAADGWDALATRTTNSTEDAFDLRAISRGVADHVATTGQPITLLNAAESEDWQARTSVQALGLRTVWCLRTGAADGSLLYLDSAEVATADPTDALHGLGVLLRYAAPLLAPATS